MSNEEFDPCECFQQDFSIQHLLSILRQTQDYCTNTECFDDLSVPELQEIQDTRYYFLDICLIFGYILLMLFLILYQPRSLRRRNIFNNIFSKPGSHHDPPSSPPTY